MFNLILSMGILAPLYIPLHAYFSISSNIIYIFAVFLALFVHIATLRKITANDRTFLKVIVFIICCSYIYTFNQKMSSGVLIYGPLSMLIPFIMNNKTFETFKKLVFYLTVVSLISYVLYVAGVSWLPTTHFDLSERQYILYGLTITDFETLNYVKLGSLRFYGFANEPGAFGVLMVFMLIIDKFKLNYINLTFFIAGMLTFSTSFYMLTIIYLLINNFKFNFLKIYKKQLYRFIYIVSTSIFALILFIHTLGHEAMLWGDLFWAKLYYVFTDWGKFENRFFRSIVYIQENGISFFGDLSYMDIADHGMFAVPIFAGIIGGIMYMTAIGCFPKRYWIIFIALGFYRAHFIFNSIPLLVLFISHEDLIRKNKNVASFHMKYWSTGTYGAIKKQGVGNSYFSNARCRNS